MNIQQYPNVYATCSVAVFHVDSVKHVKLLLIKRKNDPYKDLWALPGGFIDQNETLKDCAYRELLEETALNLKDRSDIELRFYCHWDTPDRDQRGRIIDHVYYAIIKDQDLLSTIIAQDDATEHQWFSFSDLLSLEETNQFAFDHKNALGIMKDLFIAS